jgi:hypothetical protein
MPSWGGAGSGATTGAAIGTAVLPGWGTAIGAGAGALIGGLSGGDDKSDSLDLKSLTSQINRGAASKRQRGGAMGDDGADALAVAANYFKSLTTGANDAVTQGQRGMVIDQYDSARKAIAEFGPRGGGSTSASAQSRISQANQLADLGAAGQTAGAQGLASVGAQEAGLALSSDQLAATDLNTLISAALQGRSLDVAEAGQNAQRTAQMGEALGLLLGEYLAKQKSSTSAKAA